MELSLGLVIHVIAGSVGLLSGTTALFAQKGARIHRQAGTVFLVSMLIMGVSGSAIAYLESVYITVLAGLLTQYLVLSSWLTVRTAEGCTGPAELCTSSFGLGVALFGAYLSWQAYNGVTDNLGSYFVPAEVYFVFTGIAILAVSADLRLILTGGIRGTRRILRHLWRMCVPLYIATSSFFTGQQQVFPEYLQGTVYLSIPEYLVVLVMLFWLVRVRFSWSNTATSK